MTDLVKLYKPAAAKGVAKKRGEGIVVVRGDKAAIVEKTKTRNAPIRMPVLPMTRREFVFAMCDELNGTMPYKQLRRAVQDMAYERGWPHVNAEISRWRHRFS